jgi:hypothetical protein
MAKTTPERIAEAQEQINRDENKLKLLLRQQKEEERKAQKALDAAQDYYESNRAAITLYDAAERYLRDVLQGRFNVKKLPPPLPEAH